MTKLAYRISKSFDEDSSILPFDEAWDLLFSVTKTRYGTAKRKSMDAFDYLLSRTYMRPRDLISYVRECGKIASIDKRRINNTIIKNAELNHSEFIRDALISEIYSLIPEISDIIDMFTEIRKQILSRKVFNDNYRAMQKNLIGDRANLSTTKILEVLFHFGVIGNVTTGNHQIFKYKSQLMRFNRNENICIHRSLFQALQLI